MTGCDLQWWRPTYACAPVPEPLPKCPLYEELRQYKSSVLHGSNTLISGKFYNRAGEPNLIFELSNGGKVFLHHTGMSADDFCIHVFTQVLAVLRKNIKCKIEQPFALNAHGSKSE